MISNGVILQSSQLSRVGVNQQLLHEGSSVLVRVIADRGNGKYLGSVAGVRVNLTSGKPLTVGASFVASITTKNGVIYVSPKISDIALEKSIEINVAENSQLAGLLESLGLSADDLYLNILQQMKQQEMKLDTQLMYRIHNLALRFKGKEKRVAELLTAFAKKGQNVSEKQILQLLNYLESIEDDSTEKNSDSDEGKKQLNSLNKIDGGWFVLPFEIFNLQSDEILGKGIIRLLFESNDRLKLLNLSCGYNSRKYLFSLLFENGNCKKVRFNIEALDLENIEKETKKIRAAFVRFDMPPVVEWAEAFEIEGSACESEEFYAIGGEV